MFFQIKKYIWVKNKKSREKNCYICLWIIWKYFMLYELYYFKYLQVLKFTNLPPFLFGETIL